MRTPKAIVFDVNETLLNLAPLEAPVARALGGRGHLLPLWFSTMLHHSLVETLTGSYHSFGDIGAAALIMVAETHGIRLSRKDAENAIIPTLLRLPPHPEVPDALRHLAGRGFRLFCLTNSSAKGVASQLENAGIHRFFEKQYSVEAVGTYKPHPRAYQMVLDDLGLLPAETLMVAAHAWDLMGARNSGLQTSFIARPGAAPYPNTPAPDHIAPDLLALARLPFLSPPA